jgi:hypothetical protein
MGKELTEEQLKEIDGSAGLMFSTSQVAIMLNIEEALLLEGKGANAFLQGRYTAEARFRIVTRDKAFDGDTSSQKLFHDWIQKSIPETE